jgi:hypothetical protein
MRHREKSENMTYKIVFDILGLYLKDNEGPDYKVIICNC